MSKEPEAPDVRPGGLVTVAFLKAQLDEGNDHLGIFMPLVLDVIGRLPDQSFATEDVQEGLADAHGVAMPQQTVATLLRRATAKRYISRDSGRYRRNPNRALPRSDVNSQKVQIEQGQQRLAQALQRHAERRGLVVNSVEAALDILLRFLEAQQVVLLLGKTPALNHSDASQRESAVLAEFVQDVLRDDAALLAVLRGMLEGLVLYHAAFLPDLDAASRSFRNLQVVFDSNLVRQTLGYEGAAMRALMRETLDVLKANGVQCLVFDKTVHEIQRILAMYEARLATSHGRASLRPVPMARHFLTERYSVSDVREMSALLEREIREAGFHIIQAPGRIPAYTAGERALAARLSSPVKKDETEPRVIHDVDCVAGILTLRRGHRTAILEEARAVFATASPLVIRNTRLWWDEDEHESGIEPVVHIRALSNLAWLKKPSLCADFKVRELVALCTAALRPNQATWERFLHHLDSMQKSGKLSSSEVTAILVSAMSDRLLRDAEFEEGDPSDIDASTLDEIVDRVKATYAADAEQEVEAVRGAYEAKMAELEARARTAAERERRLSMAVEGRARTWGRRVARTALWTGVAIVVAGALALIIGHPFHGGWLGGVIGLAVVMFVIAELAGILNHLHDWTTQLQTELTIRFRGWLGGGEHTDQQPTPET
jgi:hypothetical protein